MTKESAELYQKFYETLNNNNDSMWFEIRHSGDFFRCAAKRCNCDDPNKPLDLKIVDRVDFSVHHVCGCECHGERKFQMHD